MGICFQKKSQVCSGSSIKHFETNQPVSTSSSSSERDKEKTKLQDIEPDSEELNLVNINLLKATQLNRFTDIERKKISNFSVIWLDETNINQLFISQLEDWFISTKVFSTLEDYQKYINEITLTMKKLEKVLLIISNNLLHKAIEKKLDQATFITNVFIYCSEIQDHLELLNQNKKIKKISNNFPELLDSLISENEVFEYANLQIKAAIHFHNKESFIKFAYIDFVLKLAINEEFSQSISKSFESAFSDLSNFADNYIKANYKKIQSYFQIKEQYLKEMRPENFKLGFAIRWFSKETFVYKMINETIRKGNLLHLYYIRLAINRLYSDINKIQKTQSYSTSLYRGTQLHQNEVDLWQNQKNPLMMLGFISTSIDSKVAKKFQKNIPNYLKAMIQIEVNQNTINKPIDIANFSEIPSEKEYLMQINTFLLVKEVVIEENNILIKTEISDFESLLDQQLATSLAYSQGISIYQFSQEQIAFYETLTKYDRQISSEIILATKLQQGGFYQEIVELMEFKIQNNETLADAERKNQLGQALLKLGYFEKAKKQFQECLQIRKNIFNEENILIADCYNNLGVTYANLKDCKNATDNLLEALNISKKINGEVHQDTVSAYNNIASTYLKFMEEKQAIIYLNKALNIDKQVLGEENVKIASLYTNIAILYDLQREYDKSMDYHQKALSIREKLLGSENLDTASSYNNIALIFEKQRKFQEAICHHLKTLEIRKKLLGNEHAYIANSYNNLGILYQQQLMFQEAENYHEKALTIRRNIFGEDHIETALSYNNIGIVYHQLRQFTKSLENHQKALNIRIKVLGEENLETIFSYNNMGNASKSVKDYQGALLYHYKALQLRKKIQGEDHVGIAYAYNNLANVYKELKLYDDALSYYQQSLQIKIQQLGEFAESTGDTYSNLAIIYLAMNLNYFAFDCQCKSFKVYFECLGLDHPKTQNTKNQLYQMQWLK